MFLEGRIMKKNIHKNLRNKIVHFLGIALLMGSIVTSSFLQPMLTASAASDLTPQYTTNSSGTVPTNSWTIPGQNTVINHQGGDTTNGWDKKDSWEGTSSDLKHSYLKFGTDTSNPDYQIRKYAKETATPGLYDVYLNVRGNDQKNIKPVDIVLVVDMSGSMEPYRAAAVRSGISSFLQQITNAGIGDYVNVGLVGYSSLGYLSTKTGIVKVDMKAVSAQGQVAALKGAVDQTFQGGTFTQLGIRKGTEMLDQDSSQNRKMMILLTDGVPTFSYKVTDAIQNNNVVYGTKFSTYSDEPAYTSQLWITRGWYGNYPTSYSAGGSTISNTWPATLGEAKISKDKGITLHALGIQIDQDNGYRKDPYNPYMTRQQILANMNLLATPGLYQDANSANDIEKYLQDRAQNVISEFDTVNNATISDPLGSQFQYNGTVDVKSIGTKSIVKLPTTNMTSNQLNVSDMSLGAGEEVQFHYQVRLNTETNDFKPDYWYQMNGRTTLMPNIKTPDYQVDFGVPSAKAPGTAIKVTKQWQELTDSSKRPDSINFNVTRTVNNQSTNWQASGILSKSDDWTKTFKQLSKNNQSVWLPAYDNNGNTFNYQVSSEATDGYISSITNKTNESTITNTQYGLIIDKYASNSTNTLTGAEFIVKSADGKQSYTLKDNQLQQLSPGDYTIQEIKSPTGYQLDSTVYPITLSQDGKWSSSGQGINVKSPTTDGSGYKDGFSIATDKSNNTEKNNVVRFVKNDALKKFDLTVNKVDKTTGNALKGAKFTLTDSAGKTSSYKETDPTAMFTFENLSSGTYTLKETKAPDGYITSQDVTIVISDDGNVNVTNNNGDWKLTLQNDAGNNQITLTVNNTNKTIFPSTGGSGNELYLIVGGAFILISALAGGYYIFRIKRGYR